LSAIGLLIGFGAGIVCMTWATRIRLSDFKTTFVILVAVLLVASVVNFLLLFLLPAVGVLLLLVLACLGTLGAARGTGHQGLSQGVPAVVESNWWDVFGKFDVSLVDGNGSFHADFQAPASRILFFVGLPLNVLLLFVVNHNIIVGFEGSYTATLYGCLPAALCAIPLFLIKSGHGLISVAFRIYLPLMAFCVFAANSFVTSEGNNFILYVGINVFCITYTLLMSAMLITISGRMRSLVLPAGSLLLIMFSLVSLLSYSKVDAGALIVFQQPVLITLFVLVVALLLATSGARMWHMMLEGVEHDDEGSMLGSSIQERCKALADTHNLTARETEILYILGQGYSAAYVADILVVAESTIRSHRKNIYSKLNINSREQLIDLLNKHGIDRDDIPEVLQ
jgi:DNA-binding CsgD family transcriptional regulator